MCWFQVVRGGIYCGGKPVSWVEVEERGKELKNEKQQVRIMSQDI